MEDSLCKMEHAIKDGVDYVESMSVLTEEDIESIERVIPNLIKEKVKCHINKLIFYINDMGPIFGTDINLYKIKKYFDTNCNKNKISCKIEGGKCDRAFEVNGNRAADNYMSCIIIWPDPWREKTIPLPVPK